MRVREAHGGSRLSLGYLQSRDGQCPWAWPQGARAAKRLVMALNNASLLP